jgi:molybdopterin-guanine dinucleotide biosynthesis protein A
MTATRGAILCGGASSRMGQPKALCLLPSGNTALHHVAAAMRAAGLHPVLAVTGPQGPRDNLLLSSVDTVLRDDGAPGHTGPLWGVQAALREAPGRVVFWPVDMPLVPPPVLRHLASHPAPAVHLPQEPLCAALDPSVLPAVDARLAQGHGGVRAVMRALHATHVRAGTLLALDPAHLWRRAFNTPRDLEVLHALARECGMKAPAP